MSPNRHSISAVSSVKKFNTPLKASVVLLTAIILSSCATGGGDSTTPKPSPTIPGGDSAIGGGSDGEASGIDTGSNAQAEAAIKAAEAKTKAAEEALKQAEAKTKAAEDALKAAKEEYGEESKKAAAASQEAIDAAKAEAVKAKTAAEAARVEAVAKIEAAAKEAEGMIKAAKEAAAKDAVAKVKAAEEKVKAAEARANAAEAQANEVAESLKAEVAAKEAAEAKAKKAEAEKKAAEAKTKAAESETKEAQAKVKTAEEKSTAALKAVTAAKEEADKKIVALEKATASQVAAAEKEAKAAKDALKTAEAQAITAAKAAAKAATDASLAAAKEAAAKLEAIKTTSASQIDAAKKEAAAAQARADKAVKDAAAAQKLVEAAEAKANEVAESLKTEVAAKEAAEAKTKSAEAETKKAQDKVKTAEEKAAAAIEAVAIAKAEADKKVAAIEKASASQIAAAKQEAKTAQEALKTAEAQAINAAKAAAKAAADAADAAAKEAAAKLEAVKTASASQIDAAKKEAAAAQARADKAVADAAIAQKRAETAETTAKLEAEKSAKALKAQATAEKATENAQAAAKDAIKAKEKAEATAAAAEKAKADAEKALEEALANGGGSEALQKEAERKAKLAEQAQAEAEAAQAAAQAAQQAAAAQVAAAQQAQQAAEAALTAATIKNAPEANKSGVQSLNIDPSAAGLPNAFTATSRDFNATANSVEARADTASGGLLPIVNITTSGTNDTNLQNGFKSHDDSTEITTALGVLPLTYSSTYKNFGDDMRIGHIDGDALLALDPANPQKLPVNGVAVVGNATQAANMPTEGKVGYTGDATYRKLGIGNNIEFGKSVFTADFVAKNVKGDLTFANAGKIGLTAGINGNQFSGTAANNAGYNTEGGFFGGDAQYLGGVYEGKGAQGTYGAKSDKQTAAEQAAKEAQAQAAAAEAATAAAQAQAAAAQAAAEKAKADAVKAKADAVKAQQAADNAGDAGQALQDALDRAAEAERLKDEAEKAATIAVAAAKAEAAATKAAAEAAAIEAAAKLEAVKTASANQIEAAKKEAAAAQARADKALKDATAAQDRAEKAEANAKSEAEKAAAANAEKVKAEQAVLAAKAQADAANKLAADEKQKATAAQKEADEAKGELATAQQKLAEAEKALEDALASGGVDTDALQAEVDRRQAALDVANAKATAAQQVQAAAVAAAAAQVAAAQQAQQAAEAALSAATIKNAPESKKSGAQTLNVNVVPLSKVYNATTRDFSADENSVIARADIASQNPDGTPGLLGALTITTSGDGDTAVAGSNGFKAHKDNAIVGALGQELPLAYTSTYKDFGDDMRIGHIDGTAAFSGLELPVNGAAVVGNATQAANMPTEGKVGYTGDATYRKLGIGDAIEFGKSVFTADFVAKNVKGDLTFANAGKIGLTASINGNQFSGTAADNAGYSTEGGFFGGDAQYLGGVYAGNDAQGTYGAKSDKQTAAEKAATKAQADADKANAAIAGAQAQAAAAQAAADKAQADAVKAQEALARAEDALANAGTGDGGLTAALERAALAEAAQVAAEDLAAKSKIAQTAAETAQAAAQSALIAAQKAADKAVGEAKAAAEALVAQAKADTDTANAAAALAQSEAKAAKAAAEKAKTDAATMVAAANAEKAKAEQAALAAKADADASNKLAADEKAKATAAQKEANEAKSDLVKAEADLDAANKALEDALASGGGNTEALQAEVDRRQAALDAANAKVTAAQQAQTQAAAAAAAQVAAANQAAQDAKDALAASQIKNAPESKKSGVQTLNVNVVPLSKVYNATTRDFTADKNSVIARADIASQNPDGTPGLLGALTITTSGDGDTAVAGSNGFKAHKDNAIVGALGQELPLAYTSTYKDFGDDMRIGHIDGTAAFSGLELPVNGAAVVGNATQAANMPTEGKVGYTGDATYRKLGIGDAIEFGKSVFTADFVAKNVKGDLTFANAGKIGLTASINGNQFSGTAADNAGYSTEGGFFGGDAQYLGGVYAGNDAQGTYGAKSDKQTAAEKAATKAQADADKANAAIAGAQAQAAAAQAAADKAQADAVKAQEALARAEDALANAGTGDGGLTAALERAALAEAAEAAALKVAETAEAAKDAALLAKASADAAAIAAQLVADKAIGDANEQKAAKERAEVAKAAADKTKNEALAAKVEADKAKDEALVAKAKAESARDEAIARAEAAEAEALEAANAFSDPDSRISGFQSTSVGKEDGIFENNVNSYDKLKFYTNEVDDRVSLKPIELNLRGANKGATDSIYNANSNGFKEYKGSTSFDGHLGITIYNRNLDYSSVYKNFDDQMQIGHINGKTTGTYKEPISNVYVQGNATNLGDMDKLTNVNEGKAKYNGVASYIAGATGKVVVDGKSKFDVDFVARSLKGELTFTDKQVDINADITNNTFASKEGAAVNIVGGFYGKGAGLLGGVYEREDSSGYIKGTYGATKLDPTVEVVPDPTESKMTGFQSTSLSSIAQTVVGTKLENAIGYVTIRDDKSDFTERTTENGSVVPVDNRKGDNFKSFDTGVVRADMVKPENVANILEVSLKNGGSVTVDAGKGTFNPKFNYSAVYKNFDSQMQTGHLYGNFNTLAGDVSRAANVYVEGYLTSQYGMDNLKTINDGKAQYKGVATYIENIHLADNASTAPVNGNSAFNADFVSGKVDGTLSFAAGGYKYMPAGNEIKINADITGNTFAGNVGGIDTAGGFYGTEGKFLGGIYQDASVQGGKGTVAGTGTKFQGTFGAEKQ